MGPIQQLRSGNMVGFIHVIILLVLQITILNYKRLCLCVRVSVMPSHLIISDLNAPSQCSDSKLNI